MNDLCGIGVKRDAGSRKNQNQLSISQLIQLGSVRVVAKIRSSFRASDLIFFSLVEKPVRDFSANHES